ncbi:M-phase phosphoprotein 6-like [Argonauta hians]
MAAGDGKKTKLSKNVLGLKFMQKTVIRLEKEQNEDESNRLIDDEHWVIDRPVEALDQSCIEINPSYVSCEDLVFGRMSFLGFNPEVEKLMKNEELIRSGAREDETSVGDEEMAQRFSTIRSRPSKRPGSYAEHLFHSKPGHSVKKKVKRHHNKFLKPEE